MSKTLTALLALGCLAAPSAWAQAYPTKQVTILVPAAPGGVSDSLARALAQRFGEA
jgi:tripartite-type tricarboxylate transporter receptor subunit TctC